MSTQRVIARRTPVGYDFVCLKSSGDSTVTDLNSFHSSEDHANNLFSGDIAEINGAAVTRQNSNKLVHSTETIANVIAVKIANARLISIYDPEGTAKRDVFFYNADEDGADYLFEEDGAAQSPWLHFYDEEEAVFRMALKSDIEEHEQARAGSAKSG